MPKKKYNFWWNNKKKIQARKKYIDLSIVLGFLIYLPLLHFVSTCEYIFLSLGLGGLFIVLIDSFLKLPNLFIDEKHNSEVEQKNTRLLFLIFGLVFFYFMTVPILSSHFPIFKFLVFFDSLKHFQCPFGLK